MAMSHRFRKKVVIFLMLHQVMRQTIAALLLVIKILEKKNSRKRIRSEASEAYVVEDKGGDGDNEGNSPQSVNNYDAPQTESESAKKKRKTSDGIDIEALYEMVGELVANTNKLKDVAKFIGYELSLGQKRENIFSLLSTIPDLDDLERYDLCDVIAKDSGKLEVFFGLPMEHREPYVRRLLDRLGGR